MTESKPRSEQGGRSRRQILIYILLGAFLTWGVAIGVGSLSEETTDKWDAPNGSVWDPDDAPEVELGTTVTDIDRRNPMPGDGSVDLRPEVRIEGDPSSSVRYDGEQDDGFVLIEEMSLSGDVTFRHENASNITVDGTADGLQWQDPDVLSQETDIRYRGGTLDVSLDHDTDLLVVDPDNGDIITTAEHQDGEVSFSLEDEGDSWTEVALLESEGAPEIDRNSADPVGPQSDAPDTLSVDVNDPDGGDITVEFEHNGEVVGTDTVEGSGTASISTDSTKMGENEWSVTATDALDQTDSESFDYQVPQELKIRDVNTQDVIDEANVTVEFFSGEVVVEKKTTDGTVDMTGLDPEQELIVTVDAEGYHSRSTIIPSILDQQDVWLLDETEDFVLNEFELDDNTGNFPTSETRLRIERPIEDDDGDRTFQVVAGDYFGADGVFSADLEQGQRYRLSVVNDDGQQRSVGVYTPQTDGLRTIEIGSTSWEMAEDESYATNAGIEEQEINGEEIPVLYFEFGDPEGRVSDLDVRIEDRFNSSNVIAQDEDVDPTDYRLTVNLNDNQTDKQWVVNYTATVDGEVRNAKIPVSVGDDVNLPMDAQWLEVFVIVILVMIAAAFPGPLASAGSIAVVSMAGVGIIAGWLSIPLSAWFAAATIATLGLLRDRRPDIA